MSREERGRTVEDAHALSLELVHDPVAVFDSREVARDVEAVERDVARAEREQRVARRQEVATRALPATRGQPEIGLGHPVGDNGEFHA